MLIKTVIKLLIGEEVGGRVKRQMKEVNNEMEQGFSKHCFPMAAYCSQSLHKSDYKVKAGCLVYCFSAAQINSLGSVTLHKYCVSTLTGEDSHKLN